METISLNEKSKIKTNKNKITNRFMIRLILKVQILLQCAYYHLLSLWSPVKLKRLFPLIGR